MFRGPGCSFGHVTGPPEPLTDCHRPKVMKRLTGLWTKGPVVRLLAFAAMVAMLTSCASAGRPARIATSPSRSNPSAARPSQEVVPVTKADLVGRWVPATPASKARPAEPPYLLVGQGGKWSGSDGCNYYTGGWTVGSGGSVSFISESSTAVGCVKDLYVVEWFLRAHRATLSGSVLSLFASSGRLIARVRLG